MNLKAAELFINAFESWRIHRTVCQVESCGVCETLWRGVGLAHDAAYTSIVSTFPAHKNFDAGMEWQFDFSKRQGN